LGCKKFPNRLNIQEAQNPITFRPRKVLVNGQNQFYTEIRLLRFYRIHRWPSYIDLFDHLVANDKPMRHTTLRFRGRRRLFQLQNNGPHAGDILGILAQLWIEVT